MLSLQLLSVGEKHKIGVLKFPETVNSIFTALKDYDDADIEKLFKDTFVIIFLPLCSTFTKRSVNNLNCLKFINYKVLLNYIEKTSFDFSKLVSPCFSNLFCVMQ